MIGVDLARTVSPRAAVPVVFASPACAGHARAMVRPLISTFRACELCSNSIAMAGRLLCNSDAARLAGGPQALDVARAAQGSCGPNARHLDMPGWA